MNKAQILSFFQKQPKRSFKKRQLFKSLAFNSKLYKSFKVIIGDLVNEGQIYRARGGKYMLATGNDFVDGTINLTSRGSGFIDSSDEQRIFISKRSMNGAVSGDIVRARFTIKDSDRRIGRVEKILSRNSSPIIGKIDKYRGKHILETLTPFASRKIYISNFSRKYKLGSVVRCSVVDWGSKASPVFVKINKVVSLDGDPLDDISIITEKYSLSTMHSNECIDLAASMIENPILDKKSRKDYSKMFTLAIDPESARDHDDAISLEKTKNGWLLVVHISDVASYIKQGDVIDVEAKRRGNSVYFPDHHIPMLPLSITQKLCSLTKENRKAALSVEINLDKHCNLLSYRFIKSLVKVDDCLSYTKANKIITDNHSKLHDLMNDFDFVSKKLMENRIKSGSLILSSSDVEILIDDTGLPISIKKKESLNSHRIVEEFMLLANVCAADFISTSVPIYRIHGKPEDQDISNLLSISRSYDRKNKELKKISKKHAIRDLLLMYRSTKMEFMINNLCLRAMPKAIYSTKKMGHYALSFDLYTHFTSPIRRYSDIIVHRLIHSLLDKSESYPYKKEDIRSIAGHCTSQEILTIKAEREYIKVKLLRYMSKNIGRKYVGVVSGLVDRGVFIHIEDVCVDGFSSYEYMDDYYIFNEKKMISIGKKFKNKYYIGKQLEVEIVHVNLQKKMLDVRVI